MYHSTQEQQLNQANEEPAQSVEQSTVTLASFPSDASEATTAHSQETSSAAQSASTSSHQASGKAQRTSEQAGASSSSSCSSGHGALDSAEASPSFQPLAPPDTSAVNTATAAVHDAEGNMEAEASTSPAASLPERAAGQHTGQHTGQQALCMRVLCCASGSCAVQG